MVSYPDSAKLPCMITLPKDLSEAVLAADIAMFCFPRY